MSPAGDGNAAIERVALVSTAQTACGMSLVAEPASTSLPLHGCRRAALKQANAQ
jgi:hypothetical protein